MNYSKTQDTLYDEAQYSTPGFKLLKIKKLLPKSQNLLLLDVACGDGYLSKYFENFEYHGIDFAKEQVQKAKKRKLKVICYDLTKKWPYKDKKFDVLLASEIIEHVFDTDFFLSECNRVLKPGGIIILTTPNICSLGARIKMLFGKRPPAIECRAGKNNAGHIRAFSYADLKELFEDNSFAVEKTKGSILYLPILSLISQKACIKLADIFPKLSAGFIIRARKK